MEAVRQAFEAELGQHNKSFSRPRAKHRSLMRKTELARSSADGSGALPPADSALVDSMSIRKSLDQR